MGTRAWRLLLDGPGSAAQNMAVDEALLLHTPGPVLRLYAWAGPCISVGYRQKQAAWLERARAQGVGVVRRISGGGTVVHDGDLTYCVVAPADTPGLPGDLAGSYAWIRDLLVAALHRAGVAASAARPRPGAARLDVCFAGSTGSEVELDGRKLIGSAQRRTPRAFLQHGSIRLRDDSALYESLLGSRAPAFAAPGVDPDALRASIVAELEHATGAACALASLSPAEHTTVQLRAQARARYPLSLPPLSLKSRPGPDR